MADAPLQIDVFPVQARAELGRPAQVGARSKDAEAATEPRHAGGIGPVRRLAGIVDNAEDVIGREIEDRQPVEPGPAGPGIALAALPGGLPGACGTLVGAQPHRVHKTTAKAGMALQVVAQLALDRAALMIARTKPDPSAGEAATLLDAVQQGFSGRDGCENEGHVRRDRVLDMLNRAGPLDLAERSVNYNELVAGNDVREQNRHRLAVLAAIGVDCDQGAATNQLSALAGDGDIGSGHGVDPRMDGMCRVGGAAPRSGVRVSTGPRGARPPSGSADDGARLPVSAGTRVGVRAMKNRDADERRSEYQW